MDQDEINHREWTDPANWSGGILGRYASPRDSRLWVPKRNPVLGWTLNFAHPASMYWLVGLVLVGPLLVMGVIMLVAFHGH